MRNSQLGPQGRAELAITNLISNKREWNNCFIKNAPKMQKNQTAYQICRAWYNGSYTMMTKPMKTLELHYTMIQFLIICDEGSFLLYIQRSGLFADMQIKLVNSFLANCVSNHFLLHRQSLTINYVLQSISIGHMSCISSKLRG